MTSVHLKSDWDYQPRIDFRKKLLVTGTQHVTRTQESTKLIDFIQRSNEGALLLCGERGSGKTSLLYSCISRVDPQKIIPVLLNAASIEKIIESSKSEKSNSTKIIVQQFIRSLYSQTKNLDFYNNDLKKKTAELFSKATASHFSNKSKFELSRFLLKEQTIKINLITGITVIVSGFLSFFDIPEKWMLYLLTSGSGSWFAANYAFQLRQSYSNVASQYLQHDYDLATMQSEFETLLDELSDKYRIVFVIDELDKLDNQLDFVKSIKMLINQSSARYIFISDPSILSSITVPKSMESTLFSQYLFLKHPTFDEMDDFLDQIIDESDFDADTSDFETFKKFLLFESRSHFFSLYNIIRDYIHKTASDGRPILEFEINDGMKIKANLQKSTEWIYDRRKSPHNSQWEENNTILTHLYDVAHELTITPIGTNFVVESDTIKLGKSIPIGLTVAIQTACTDFLRFLIPQGYLREVQENNYLTIGEFSEFKSKPGGIFIKEQEIFVQYYEELIKLATNFLNVFNNHHNGAGIVFDLNTIHPKWDDAQNINGDIPFDSYIVYRDMYLNIKQDSSAYYTSTMLQPKISELQNFLSQLQDLLPHIISSILSKHLPQAGCAIYHDIDSNPILNSVGIPNRNCNNIVMDYSFTTLKINNIIFVINPDSKLPELIKKSSLRNTLIIFLSKKSFYTPIFPSLTRKLKKALKEAKKSNCYLKMKIPIDYKEFDNLISILTDETFLQL